MIFFKQKLPVLVGSIVLVILVMQGAQAIGLFGKKEPAYPFSGFSGQLFYEGKPAAYAKVTRSYELLDEKYEETIEADENGRFSFESIVVNYKTPILAEYEFRSHQRIFVEFETKTIQIWGTGKRTKEEFSEFGGKPVELRCELTEESRRVDLPTRGLVGTNCYWHLI